MKLKEFFIRQGWAVGFAEVRRYCQSGTVKVNGIQVYDAERELESGDHVQFGKRREGIV